ncbi:ATP-binding protein [Streptomyces sp. NPDC056254]|uniref:ATP-binding protein n=1 Tax=Streptomyces sp. NPDC056254 TaxID=3345763 RepID=UPI0035E0DA3C
MHRLDQPASVEPPSPSTCVTLRAEARSVPVARRLVRELLRTCETKLTDDVADTASIVVTELFTNAVVHSGATTIRLSLQIMGENLWVEVADDGLHRRRIHERSAMWVDENGRGLLLVRELSQAWGQDTSCLRGTRVWAALALTH